MTRIDVASKVASKDSNVRLIFVDISFSVKIPTSKRQFHFFRRLNLLEPKFLNVGVLTAKILTT